MPKVPIIMPQLGESIAEATVVRLTAKVGDQVESDQEVIEVETNKAVMSVTTPCDGVIESFQVEVNETYPIGNVLGYIEASVEDAERLNAATKPASDQSLVTEDSLNDKSSDGVNIHLHPSHGLEIPVDQKGGGFNSPRLRARLQELGMQTSDAGVVPGSGIGGRVTIEDFEAYLQQVNRLPSQKASPMRLAVADSMRRSWTRPLATLGVSISLEPILAHRKTLTPSPGPALYLAKAVAIALAESPQSAGRLVGNKIVLPASIDIGVAVEVEDGVVVPVFANLDKQPLADLPAQYKKFLQAAKEKRLPQEASIPAIATVTNFGTLGVHWATPIPLPSETLIVGLGYGEKRPFWDENSERFVPRLEAELTVSFDHRVIDGGQSGRLVRRIVALLAKPEGL
ncbi:MAG TPA: 2-oxo acid dehydrogenase subunit E2 [Chthoniobacterales bacterium]|jgi:pyruvate/2-oxoglutarate dehydrogenase complex dihydrolipoamide acyltransferase (E2) component|nr:2-oxo acid dehydrogenase subunit E2 [Chthoniobacterales bacterium]